MNDDNRREIETLATEGACNGAVRYVTTLGTTQWQCDRGEHAGTVHWNEQAGLTWFGPAEPVQRIAS